MYIVLLLLLCYSLLLLSHTRTHIHTHTHNITMTSKYLFLKRHSACTFCRLGTVTCHGDKTCRNTPLWFPWSKTARFLSAYFNSNCTNIHETVLMWANSMTLSCLLWTSDFLLRYLCHDANSNNRKNNNNIAEHTQKHLQFLNKLIEQNKGCNWVRSQRIKTDYHYSMKHMQNFI